MFTATAKVPLRLTLGTFDVTVPAKSPATPWLSIVSEIAPPATLNSSVVPSPNPRWTLEARTVTTFSPSRVVCSNTKSAASVCPRMPMRPVCNSTRT